MRGLTFSNFGRVSVRTPCSTRAEIFENAWDQTYRGNSNMVDVYVNYLRNKTQAEGEPKMIHTIRGKGYCLREPTGYD